LGVGGILLAISTAEGALRAGGVQFDLVPSLQFGWPDPVTLTHAYESDPDLIWVTRDYREILWAARRTHPTVVFMGDSCTEFGSYPARTIARLQAAGSALSSGVKFGVGGWSTEQGLEQLRRDVIPLHPKLVTIYYGWNDHWIAMGLTDPEISSAHRLRVLARHSRIVQLWLRMKVGVAARRTSPPNRVPLQRYEDNLRAMAREAKAAGMTPVFITAPSSHVKGREPPSLALRHLRHLDELIPLHTAYIETTLRVARDTHTALCDAAGIFGGWPEPHDRLFQRDGIHLTDAGNEAMADVVSRCILRAEAGSTGTGDSGGRTRAAR
jgi:lysophospholipase L1-like esterase